RSSNAMSSSATRSPTSSRRRSRTAPRFAPTPGLGTAFSQCDDRLLDAPLPGLGRLGVLDRKHESLLLAEGQSVEHPLGLGVSLERGREIGRYVDLPRF